MISDKVRKLLDQMDDVLSGYSTDAEDLWAVLTAMRGPDSGSFLLKQNTTVLLRRAAFPKTANNGNDNVMWADFSSPATAVDLAMEVNGINSPRQDRSSHFLSHVSMAGEVLGLIRREPLEHFDYIAVVPPDASQS